MNLKTPAIIASAIVLTAGAWCQPQEGPGQNVPLYRVTVIERTVKAVNYQYRSGPTQIDFRGTVLLPEAKGDATVESKQGRTEVDARFERVLPPARYGHEYLTYVLWAITPEGHAKNLGEVLAGSSDKAKLHVTTDLQAFGLIVTAEPYAAVRQPSDVVVMENQIRPDTLGKIEPIQAKFELMPRGQYTYNVPADLVAAEGNGPSVPMSLYEEMLEVYQAQNAVQIAGAMGAAQYAPDTFARAQQLLQTAQDLQVSHADKSQVIANARESAQTAEDARAIALKRKQDAEVAEARSEAARERQRRLRAEAEAQTAQAQSSADRMMLDQERIARQQAEARAAAAQIPPPPPPPVQAAVEPLPQNTLNQHKRDLRMSLYQQLGESSLEASDTPRGLVVTIPAGDFNGAMLRPAAAGPLAQVSAAIAAHPELSVEVDDNGDVNSAARAEAVRSVLIQRGVRANAISVRSVGNNRPIASNTTAEGRELNRRVEITISGETIGNMPYWDRSYSIVPR
ncbi:OmpA/MotB domain protein [Candidatus Sulfopaludibacter sp. SbA3]|nr:OmpA/MotB domain protein [Candidatus Sulfopaludibacter sp. SbA3]